MTIRYSFIYRGDRKYCKRTGEQVKDQFLFPQKLRDFDFKITAY